MALPRFFLQGSRYPNLTTIRTSDDRFGRSRWDSFLYTSQFARAAGIWPWADVFMSGETNNLLVSVLSAGMVGIGDAMGMENRENLMRVARADGVPAEHVLTAKGGDTFDLRPFEVQEVAGVLDDDRQTDHLAADAETVGEKVGRNLSRHRPRPRRGIHFVAFDGSCRD